ncbi:MAG: superoxide dismutase [Parcubacteria group bacterium]|nr:superoxide dismutase [Parcubacteria group bacterium]
MTQKNYQLPELSYGYGELSPFISEEQLKLHHDKHHLAYVNGANSLLEKLAKARQENSDLDLKAALKELSFHLGGHVLHSLFWRNLAPVAKGGGGEPAGILAEKINNEFGDFQRFKKEFTQAALTVEGSGWAALGQSLDDGRLLVMQIEKHNINLLPQFKILLVLDLWEHAYYLDYKNERAKFIEVFWKIVSWSEAEKKFTYA